MTPAELAARRYISAWAEPDRAAWAALLESRGLPRYDVRMIPAELAARRYIDLWSERDPAARAALVEACFAVNCRFVTRRRTFHGRAEVAAMIDAALADPRGVTARATSVIDAGGETFRFRAVVEYADGSPPLEGLDIGEVDADGRIIVLYTFAGALADAPPAP